MNKKKQELKDLKESLAEFKADGDTDMVAVFEEEIKTLEAEIEVEGKKPTKKAKKVVKVKRVNELKDWQKKAKSLGLKYIAVKKETVLAQIEAKEGKPTPKPDTFDEKAKKVTLKKGFVLERNVNGIEWEVNSPKSGESFTGATIRKTGDEYAVSIKHTTLGFKSFGEAVGHLETELVQGVLSDYIDEGINKAIRAKNYKELTFAETVKKDTEVIVKKAEELKTAKKTVSKTDEEILVTGYKKMAKSIYLIMPKAKFKIFAEKQIKYWQSLIKEK